MAATRSSYWRRSIRLVLVLLAIWALVSLGAGIVFVDYLNQFQLGGFPLGFWFAQQGSILCFILLIAVYCVVMDRFDTTERKRLAERDEQ